MPFFFLLLAGFNTGLSGAMIPGPLFLFTLSEVLKKNAAAGLKVCVGHVLVELLFVGIFLLGFANIAHLATWTHLISLAGAGALVGMGGFLLLKTGTLSLSRQETVAFPYGPYLGGIFFSVVSPGFVVWWATLGGPLLLQALPFGKFGVLALMLSHWAADFVWHVFVSYSVQRGKRILTDRTYQTIMRLLALVLVGTGLVIFRRG